MTFAPAEHPRTTDGRFTEKTGLAAEVTLADAELPVVTKTDLSHVGTLEASAKKSFSYEGQGLSVSEHPEDWQRIARLGGDTHWFSNQEARLLDFHELSNEQRADIYAYAEQRGWVEPAEVYIVTRYDDEFDEEMEMRFLNREEAEGEAGEWDDEDSVRVEQSYVYADMPDSTARPGEVASLGVLAASWVGEQRPDLDGVWWEDDLDPSKLSAPRGVIVPQRIEAWLSAYRQA